MFREQAVDGPILLMLREEHLLGDLMRMKLGAVLKFKAALASKVGSCPVCLHCIHCHTTSNIPDDNVNKDTHAPDETISNRRNNTNNHKEEKVSKASDLPSLEQEKIETFSTSEVSKNNGSNEKVADSVDYFKEKQDREQMK